MKLSRLAKILMGLMLGYTVSPVDLIPDFIPVLGQLDDTTLWILLIVAVFLFPRLRKRGSNRLSLPAK